MLPFYTPWKDQKTSGFLIFSGGIERNNWPEMGKKLVWLQILLIQIVFSGNSLKSMSEFRFSITYKDFFR